MTSDFDMLYGYIIIFKIADIFKEENDWISLAIFSFPCRCDSKHSFEIQTAMFIGIN